MAAVPLILAACLIFTGAVASAEQVTIYRDRLGVPHVEGDTSSAVLYGAGYALAQDRLAQLELNRWTAAGRLAELIGPDGVESDRAARIGGYTGAELTSLFDAMPPEYRAMMRSYVAGINRYVAEVNADPVARLPYEFKEWGIVLRPWMLLDYLRMVVLPANTGSDELTNLEFYNEMVKRYGPATAQMLFDDVLPLNDPEAPPAIQPGENRAAPLVTIAFPPAAANSNTAAGELAAKQFALIAPPTARKPRPHGASRCLMISPRRSASGHVLMLQGTSDGPSIFLRGGGFDTAGFTAFGDTIIGVPVMGRGPTYGWFLTAGEIDTGDTYAEHLNPRNRHSYWYRGAWHDMDRRTETIRIKGASPVKVEIVRTIHGLVIAWDVEHHAAFSRRGASDRASALGLWMRYIDMGRARSMQEFEAAIAKLSGSIGVCYGDEQGRVAFWEAGRVPIRPAGQDPRLPTPGTGEYEWQGFLPFEQLPHLLDPREGFFHTWNNTPTRAWVSGENARYGKTFRSYLGVRLVEDHPRPLTLDDLRTINRQIAAGMGGQDLTATSPEFFLPYLRAATRNEPRLHQAVEAIARWNGLYEDLDHDGYYDQIGLEIFRNWLLEAQATILGDDIGEWWHRIDDSKYIKYRTSLLLRIIAGPRAEMPVKYDFFDGRDPEATLRETLQRTLDKLAKHFGSTDIATWQEPVYWTYYDPAQLGRDPHRPFLERANGVMPRAAGRLGLIPRAVPNNGAEGWSGLMEIAPGNRVLYEVTRSGGQNLFIDQRGMGNPHLGDQVQSFVDTVLEPLEMDPEKVRQTAESKQTLELPARSTDP